MPHSRTTSSLPAPAVRPDPTLSPFQLSPKSRSSLSSSFVSLFSPPANTTGGWAMHSDPSLGVLQTGWMKKRGHFVKSWKTRFFVLRSNGSLTYYRSDGPAPHTGVDARGTIPLLDATVCTLAGKPSLSSFATGRAPSRCLCIVGGPGSGKKRGGKGGGGSGSKDFVFEAGSEAEAAQWCRAIRAEIERVAEERRIERRAKKNEGGQKEMEVENEGGGEAEDSETGEEESASELEGKASVSSRSSIWGVLKARALVLWTRHKLLLICFAVFIICKYVDWKQSKRKERALAAALEDVEYREKGSGRGALGGEEIALNL